MSRLRAYQMIDAGRGWNFVYWCRQSSNSLKTNPPAYPTSARSAAGCLAARRRDCAGGQGHCAHVQAAVNEYKNPVLQDKARAVQAMGATVFSHDSLDYYTPQWVIDAAREVMGGIDPDPASCEAANTWIMANRYYTIDQDGLSLPWYGRVWLNPPYNFTNGKSNQDAWSYRLATEYRSGAVSEGMLWLKPLWVTSGLRDFGTVGLFTLSESVFRL